ncbi:TPA: C/D box methylation guide ribonucleoprotein complex aNOP56 subunit [Methanopyrus kandleri]|uniref:Protein implicated in ribosomal biogenesis, Nop56p homolog n=2 Tax=Methanopyrus kandleri TaxID=2320 RepID=Q8TXV0_METKA|nr:Protein implicated in ribosomal biogenesis, Nop56p homolog [Methanopyrus kandleri AV19]HII70220.1 C/D box methylation guide ribonucleoprotein complex aNOP56 subunit [Methanopyrus kandleri]
MGVYVAENFTGVYAFDEEGNLIDHEPFPKDPDEIVERLLKRERGEVLEEEEALLSRLDADVINFEGTKADRERLEEVFDGELVVEFPNVAGEVLRERARELAVEVGVVDSEEEYSELVYEVGMKLSKEKVRATVEERDQMIIQAINTIDDIDRILNILTDRVREWYGIHFPEINKIVKKHDDFVTLVAELGHRKNFTYDNIKEVLPEFPDHLAEKLEEAAKDSMGAEMDEKDLAAVQRIAEVARELYEIRRKTADYIDESMDDVAPNVKALVGPLIGARLIALAGGLKEMAKLPASTIQLLGAEKALFRHLTKGTKPPKHGVIFQHPLIHRSPWWQRGKIARALAGKLAIAARIDAYSGEYRGDELRRQLEQRVKEIKEKYPKPPKRKRGGRPPRGRRPRRRRSPRRSRRDRRRRSRRRR